MKHSLQLRLSQHLTLTPQLQQSIRLLQLSTLELNQELERFLQENPLLERDEGAGEPVAIPSGLHPEPAGDRTTEVTSTASDDNPSPAESDVFTAVADAPYGSGSREDGDEDD